MNFRTKISVPISEKKVSYNSSSMFMGSCFTENIGNKLAEYQFPIEVNPFGIIYNPISVKKGIKILIEKRIFTENDLFFFNEQWLSFNHHGSFSHSDKDTCLNNINNRIISAAEKLKSATFLFITFGTAWVFKLKEKGKIVSNCHKMSAKFFERRLIEVPEIVDEYKKLFTRLNKFNPQLQIVFTVSPIRHLKDSAEENQVSKSTLILAVHELKKMFKNVDYFPAYEIMMDELRDYRFYEEDMIHPNQTAINYLWQKFSESFLDPSSINLMKEIEKIIQAKNHKPFHSDSEEYLKFLKMNLDKIEKLSYKYPNLNFEDEKNFFASRLVK